MYKIKRYFAGVWKQAKKVRWPKKKEMLIAVSVVLVFVVVSALALAIDDFIIARILSALQKAFQSTTTSETSETACRFIETIGRNF